MMTLSGMKSKQMFLDVFHYAPTSVADELPRFVRWNAWQPYEGGSGFRTACNGVSQGHKGKVQS
jgi:hypothetical protein